METRSIKRLRQRQGSDNKKTNLMDIDNDNLVDIFSKQPAKSLIQLGYMSKTLSNIVSCPYFVKQHMHFLTATNAASEVPRLMVVAQSKNRYAGELTVLQSLQYDGTSLEKSRHTIVSKVIFRRQNYSIDLEFLFCNLVCLKDSNYGYGRRCLLLNPLKGEVVILPVDNTIRSDVPANPIPKSYEYWYGMGFDNANKYKVVRVFGYKFDYDFGYTC
ncbi:F-box protein CPR1-like [Pyrus communis]|uniref:F-box protein CPR1-like n=1 Tax=Pyrus communis TaxID=23211 RepID=UPI0035C24146